jgi:hypothetical protein
MASSDAIDVLYPVGRDRVVGALAHLATFASHIRRDPPM